MGADSRFYRGELRLPIVFDIFGMESQGRIAVARMLMTHLHHRADRGRVDARHNHGFHSVLALTCDHFFAILVESFFINMTMCIYHARVKILLSP